MLWPCSVVDSTFTLLWWLTVVLSMRMAARHPVLLPAAIAAPPHVLCPTVSSADLVSLTPPRRTARSIGAHLRLLCTFSPVDLRSVLLAPPRRTARSYYSKVVQLTGGSHLRSLYGLLACCAQLGEPSGSKAAARAGGTTGGAGAAAQQVGVRTLLRDDGCSGQAVVLVAVHPAGAQSSVRLCCAKQSWPGLH